MLSGRVKLDGEIISATPAELNWGLLAGEIDASAVSSFWYAEHSEDLTLLPDLSISSESGVRSVLLFSRKPIESLSSAVIYTTPKGRSTPALLRILCQKRYGFIPRLESGVKDLKSIGEDEAVLVIGDEALASTQRRDISNLQITDLAEEWRAWTGKPFVFAVWAVRREIVERYPESVASLHQTILESKKWGLAHLDVVVEEAIRRTGLPRPVLEKYFSVLKFDFDTPLKEAMRLYFDTAAECGLLNLEEDLCPSIAS